MVMADALSLGKRALHETNQCQRIRIDLLCRSSGKGGGSPCPDSPLAPRHWALATTSQGSEGKARVLQSPQVKEEPVPPAEEVATKVGDDAVQSFFVVNLFVAALGDGKLILEGARKKQDILEQVVRNVSKEQNTVVHIPSEGMNMHLKLRVFVENSIEAKAVVDYIAAHPNQNPAPFVILSRKLHIAVSYNSNDLDISCASVADRLRKQAKTRAVKMLREAIADPTCGATMHILRGFAGPNAPSLCLDKYITSRSSFIGSDRSKCYMVFPAKNKCGAMDGSKGAGMGGGGGGGGGASSASPHSALGQRAGGVGGALASDAQLTAFFPVSLFVTAIGDGFLARDISAKLRDRLEQVLSKIPKEQHTCVEVHGEGVIDIKMRVFVTNSEDAKAVSDYIRTHEKQVPAPFVVLARDLPMALLYDPAMLDLTDSSVADRLRKQAKTRAVKLLREAIAQDRTLALTQQTLRGYNGPYEPAIMLDQILKSKAAPLEGKGSTKRYVSFSARNKACASPVLSPALAPGSPPSPRRLNLAADVAPREAHESARELGEEGAQHAAKRRKECEGQRDGAAGEDRCKWARDVEDERGRDIWMRRVGKQHMDKSSSPPPLRFWQSREGTAVSAMEQDDAASAMADAMLLIASSARAYADVDDECGRDSPDGRGQVHGREQGGNDVGRGQSLRGQEATQEASKHAGGKRTRKLSARAEDAVAHSGARWLGYGGGARENSSQESPRGRESLSQCAAAAQSTVYSPRDSRGRHLWS